MVDADAIEGALRQAVEAWNPLEAAEPGLPEYGDLVHDLIPALVSGVTRGQLSEQLWDHLEDRWGVEPWRCGVDQFADRVITWREAWPDDDVRPDGVGRLGFEPRTQGL